MVRTVSSSILFKLNHFLLVEIEKQSHRRRRYVLNARMLSKQFRCSRSLVYKAVTRLLHTKKVKCRRVGIRKGGLYRYGHRLLLYLPRSVMPKALRDVYRLPFMRVLTDWAKRLVGVHDPPERGVMYDDRFEDRREYTIPMYQEASCYGCYKGSILAEDKRGMTYEFKCSCRKGQERGASIPEWNKGKEKRFRRLMY